MVNSLEQSIQTDENELSELTCHEIAGDLDDANASLGGHKELLRNLNEESSLKRSEYEERKKVWSGEVGVINKAVEMLSSHTTAATDLADNPVLPSPPSLLQVQRVSAHDPRARAVQLLRNAAHVAHSVALQRLAEHIATSHHFDEV